MNKKELEQQKKEFLRLLEEEPPYDKKRFEVQIKLSEATMSEWARLEEGGSISRSISQWMPDGTIGHGHSVILPDDPEHEEMRTSHGLKEPGDASTIIKKLIDGQWVVQEQDKPDESGEKAKSA